MECGSAAAGLGSIDLPAHSMVYIVNLGPPSLILSVIPNIYKSQAFLPYSRNLLHRLPTRGSILVSSKF